MQPKHLDKTLLSQNLKGSATQASETNLLMATWEENLSDVETDVTVHFSEHGIIHCFVCMASLDLHYVS